MLNSPTNEILQDDATLIAQIAQNEQIALSMLYDRYARIVYTMALRSLQSREESEEIVQDVFAQVWRIANRYDASKSRVDSWLFTMARSRIIDRLRKLQRRAPITKEAVDLAQIQIPAAGVDPIEAAVISERRERVLVVLEQLSPEQRLVIELAYYQGLSQSEIVIQTGMCLGTVKTRIRLGLNKLRVALDPVEASVIMS